MFNKENIGYHCWVINRTKMVLNISDLGWALQPNSTTDILDCKHSMLSVAQVEKSLESGTLGDFEKRKWIAIRKVKPLPNISKVIDISKISYPSKNKTNIKMEEKRFKELEIDVNEDDFALQNADQSVVEHSGKTNLREQSNNSEFPIEDDKK